MPDKRLTQKIRDAMGELVSAEAHLTQEFPGHAGKIREIRKKLETEYEKRIEE